MFAAIASTSSGSAIVRHPAATRMSFASDSGTAATIGVPGGEVLVGLAGSDCNPLPNPDVVERKK